jgi:HipA-like kinase
MCGDIPHMRKKTLPEPVRTVRARKDLGRQPKGGSGSHLFDCEDERLYVVKFRDGSKNAVNEFVSYEVSRPLSAPVYEHVLVDIDDSLVKQSPDLAQRGIQAGLHHGVKYHLTAKDLDGQQFEGLNILNVESIPAVVVLDNWVLNTDRGNAGNILLEPKEGGWKVIATDFNCSFAGNWNAQTISATTTNRNLVNTHPLLAMNVTGENPFNQALETLQKIDRSYLQSVVDTIPTSWPISVDERTALLNFLESRKAVVSEVIAASRDRFPKWSPRRV